MIFTVDLHTHILPSVDDGADSIQEALEMLDMAYNNGTTHIVLTPHYLTGDSRSTGKSKSKLISSFEKFKDTAAEEYPKLNLYFGAELFSVNNIDEVISDDQVIPINGGKYVLLEFGFRDTLPRALSVAEKLLSAGYIPLIAHPERYSFIQNNPRDIIPFLEKGALLQVNVSSIAGMSGRLAQDVALSFLENGLATAVASDAHDVAHRAPDLSEAYSFVFSEFSRRYAEELFFENPLAIINGKII